MARRATVSLPIFAFRDRPGRAVGGADCGSSREARAQQAAGFAVDRFEPAAPGSRFLSLDSLDFDGHLRPAAGLVSAWAWKPLVVYDGQSNQVAALVGAGAGRARPGRDRAVGPGACGSRSARAARPQRDLHRGRRSDLRGARRQRHRRPQVGRAGARVRPARRRIHRRGRCAAVSAHRRHEGVQQRRRRPFLAAAAGGGAARSADLGGALRRPHPAAERLQLRSVAGERADGGRGRRLAFRAALRRRRRALPRERDRRRAVRVARGDVAGDDARGPPGGRAALERQRGVAPGFTDGAGTPAARMVLGVQYVVEPAPPPLPPPPAWTPVEPEPVVR